MATFEDFMKLYGGFEDKHQVYKCFTNDYDTKNTVTVSSKKVTSNAEVSTWQSEINGIHCLVRTERPACHKSI
ncbi:hypothetical protein [Tissierella sp. Yu-01]|uniref:hypothetical protein n=1 Tax=Tissierella sp. Yu-01 TaxID=3035694 RepID=UPI00240DA0DB|nr:hypothetical protein [Tissierella sp. Yu-01]WFA09029.1 hypothetical protein P3962_00235 [Tissierella sp. Yu-01]